MNREEQTDLLIIGAGPFGLAVAARAQHRGLSYVLCGKPLSFWKENMPKGMYLRSDYDWHLDPQNERTFENFMEAEGRTKSRPIALDVFLDYGRWFQRECEIEANDTFVAQLKRDGETFEAELTNGERIRAASVVCAPGFWPFRNVPAELIESVADEDWVHSAGFTDPRLFEGQRCLIVGGRQSAFETAALLAEHGAQSVSVVHRHATPHFATSDWSWVAGHLQAAQDSPGWFAGKSDDERKAIERQFWSEGRLKLEPWLGERLSRLDVEPIGNAVVERIERKPEGYRASLLGTDRQLDFDKLILATGFRVDMSRVDYLRPLLHELSVVDGFPELTPSFESSSLAGLYLVGLAAARQFGPYMGFTASCPMAARVAVDAVAGLTH